jgi:signal transduction histidine kinase/ligand-binding sensor domain-containing protein/CheY-like chemotaxis protein
MFFKYINCFSFFFSLFHIGLNVFAEQPALETYSVRLAPITINEGLSQGYVPSIIQDSRGYMWFATKDGLNRYDGYKFTIYRHDAMDSTTISDNYVENVFEDSRGLFWIKTVVPGLDVFNPESESFLHIDADSNNIDQFFNFGNFTQDNRGKLWYQSRGGLNIIEVNKEAELQNGSPKISYSIQPASSINSRIPSKNLDAFFCFDSEGNMWYADSDSLYKISQTGLLDGNDIVRYGQASFCKSPGFKIFHILPDSIHHRIYFIGNKGLGIYNTITQRIDKIIPVNISSIPYRSSCSVDAAGNVWISTSDRLLFYENRSGEIKKIVPLNVDNNEWSSSGIKSLCSDHGGIVWIGTNGFGILKYNPRVEKFHHVAPIPGTLQSVAEMKQDAEGKIYIYSNKGSLSFNRKEQKIEKEVFSEKKFGLISDGGPDFPSDFASDEPGIYWLAYPHGALVRYDAKKDRMKIFRQNSGKNFIANILIWFDDKNKIWLTGEDEKWIQHIYSFNRTNESFSEPIAFPEPVASHGYPFVSATLQQPSGIIWFATTQGLLRFNPEIKQWKTYKNIPGENSLSYDIVFTICFDPKEPDKYLWIGTSSGGLNRLDMSTDKFIQYTDKDGLPNNVIYGILSDKSNNLWLSTNKGLCHFNLDTKACKNYYASDGLQSNEFNRYAYLKAKNGELYFGGVNGFNFFNPDEITGRTNVPQISFTDFRLFNKSVSLSDSASPVHKPLDYLEEIVLKPKQNVFTLQFAALDFNASEKNQFRYKMAGFDEEWISSGSQREATYTNLNPGTYVFHVQGANSEGIWNEKGKSIRIVVLPPWWRTWWATTLAVILLIAGIFLFIHLRTKELLRQQRSLEEKVVLRTVELTESQRKAEEAKQFERQFLANMSHEIRTPMNAIIGMSNLALKTQLNQQQLKYLSGIKTSSENLLVIINDILDITKIDSGKIEFENIEFSIHDVLNTVHTTLHFKAEEKGLKLVEYLDTEIPKVLTGDPVRLGQVLINIAGNAIKFTEKGRVEVNCRLIQINEKATIEFTITDTGIGIPEDKIEKVFDSFTQASADTTRKYGGTGLGLAISRQLVELQGGTLQVRSKVGEGTSFYFTLSFHYAHESQVVQQRTNTEEYYAHKLKDIRVLIVDDNSFNQVVAADTLTDLIKGVQIDMAENGKIAVSKMEENDYDVVLMDIQMPEMDGLEATRRIRAMKSLKSKVPIMAMTAAASKIEIERCFDVGMNEYISKPFQPLALLEKMAGIVKNGH